MPAVSVTCSSPSLRSRRAATPTPGTSTSPNAAWLVLRPLPPPGPIVITVCSPPWRVGAFLLLPFCLMLSHTNVAFPPSLPLRRPSRHHTLFLALPSPQVPTQLIIDFPVRTPPSAAASYVQHLCPHVLARDATRLAKLPARCPMGSRRLGILH
jgi:hypothetical protein